LTALALVHRARSGMCAPWLSAAVAIITSFALATRSFALDLDDSDLTHNQTIAYGEGLRRWDSIKRYGAERVDNRDRSTYAPDGIRAGNYTFFPTIGTTALFDDNIFQTNTNPRSDLRFEIVPVVRAKSNFSRHLLNFDVSAKQVEYLRHQELNGTDARFNVDGALHFDHAHTLSFNALTALEHDDKAAAEVPRNAAERVSLLHNRFVAGIKRDAGRLWASFNTGIERWDFQSVKSRDGKTLSQDERDTQIVSAQVLLGYRFSPAFELQGKVRVLNQWNFNPGTVDYTGNGYEAVAGISAEINPVLRWRLLGGYGVRDYESSALQRAGNVLVEAEVQWLTTQLMTVYLTGRRNYAEGTSADEPGGRLDNSVSARLEYEALRNLIFTFKGEYRESEYFAADRRDKVFNGRVSVDYYHTKNWLFSLAYEHNLQRSNIEEDNLVRNRVWLTTKLRF
jgi:hypothetical protein